MPTKHAKNTKMLSRRTFLRTLVASGALVGAVGSAPTFRADSQKAADSIDRAALVNRHNPMLRQMDSLSPLSLGNGEFAFTADITGLQTFPVEYQE